MIETLASVERRLKWLSDLEAWRDGDKREPPPGPPNLELTDWPTYFATTALVGLVRIWHRTHRWASR